VAVLLQDPDSDRLYLRFRRDWESLLVEEDEDDLDVFRALAEDLERKAAEVGGERLFEYLQSTSSATLQITDGEPVIAEDFQRAVDRFYPSACREQRSQIPHAPAPLLAAGGGRSVP